MTFATRNRLLLLSAVLLSACSGSSYGGEAEASSFVELADLSSFHVASCYLKTKSGTTSVAVSDEESTSSSSDEETAAAHEVDFYSSDDFRYTVGSTNIVGHTDKSGLYFLLNPNKLVGYLFEDETPLDPQRAVAKAMLQTDYSYLSGLYALLQGYVGAAAAELGFDSINVYYTNVSTTVGYNASTVKTIGNVTTQIDYYLTLDEVAAGGYAFTDAIVRTTVTNYATDTIAYLTNEYNLSLVDDYSSTNYSFSPANYTIIIASGGLDTLDFNGLVGS
jgi:hypothetical protein